ncbi:hypothetical protein [Ereboglobus luteus]|uniref:Uncharacterized protein n=1 Tax=Ereboglobus luteus TaxID=1796921 RepID=A0A2U8E0L7_9BACT|nr:hypothetical protein [Ereboglobus luteus]AWI08325.1 hypothetical protein CKA38_02790 [Ereboglobus luteus]
MSNDSATLTQPEVKSERAKAIEYLRNDYLKSGDTVYVILRHVSQSGMSRFVDLYVVKNGRPLRITWTVATALAMRYNRKHESLHVGGCGFDAAHSVVYDLAWALFGDANALSHSWL